jgi:hypothetical protein
MADKDKADCEAAAEEIRAFAAELERRGFSAEAITDGLFVVAMNAAHKMAGPHFLAGYLTGMARSIEAEANGLKGAESATKH